MTITPINVKESRAPWAKDRILEKATELFYEEGIHSVGVDRLIAQSGVTKATFYKHYRSKEILITSYISSKDRSAREAIGAIVSKADGPADALFRIVESVAAEISEPDFRGCPFLNAAVEFPDRNAPVRAVVRDHREWCTALLTGLFSELGQENAGDAADEFMLATDGARAGAYQYDRIAAGAALHRVATRIIDRNK